MTRFPLFIVTWPQTALSLRYNWLHLGYTIKATKWGKILVQMPFKLAIFTVEYGPLLWLIIAHVPTEIYNTEYYWHEMTTTCFVQNRRIFSILCLSSLILMSIFLVQFTSQQMASDCNRTLHLFWERWDRWLGFNNIPFEMWWKGTHCFHYSSQ